MLDSLDDLCIGKTISLENAAKKLSEVDADDICQRWTLRFCLSKYVKVCIKLPSPVLTWEREKEPDYGISCDKCSEISDQIYEARMNNVDDDDMPSYCENCHMRKPPIMGMGDYIDQRTGVFFLPHQIVEYFTYHGTDEVSYSRFYVRDESWSSGFKEIEIASQRDYRKQVYREELDEPPATSGYLKRSQDSIREAVDSASTDKYLCIGIENLYVWKEDFEAALQLDGDTKISERRTLPMHGESLNRKPENQKKWMLEYMTINSLSTDDILTDEQLASFRSEAFKRGMSAQSFKDRRRELGIKGENKSAK